MEEEIKKIITECEIIQAAPESEYRKIQAKIRAYDEIAKLINK